MQLFNFLYTPSTVQLHGHCLWLIDGHSYANGPFPVDSKLCSAEWHAMICSSFGTCWYHTMSFVSMPPPPRFFVPFPSKPKLRAKPTAAHPFWPHWGTPITWHFSSSVLMRPSVKLVTWSSAPNDFPDSSAREVSRMSKGKPWPSSYLLVFLSQIRKKRNTQLCIKIVGGSG